jgi:undecaprenyl pyrophosphate phosphatase UppP
MGDGVIVATLFGVLTSAVTGYIAVKAMLKVIKNANYKWFSLYLIILGALTIIGGAW